MDRPSITLKIRTLYRDLSKKEREIADYILSDPKKVSRMTINEIAGSIGIATSTVFQFARKLGYSGFRDFRTDLLAEEFDPEVSIHENISPSDSPLSMARKVFASSIQSLQDTSSLLDDSKLKTAASLIEGAGCVTFFGLGGSNIVAFDAYHKFLRSPIRCQYGTDSHIQLMQASLMTERDVAVITTHTGLTKDTLEIAKVVENTGARSIAITSYPSQQLTDLVDVVLVSASEETGYRSESLSSRISQLAIIDSLFTIVMFETEDRANDSLRRIRRVIGATKEETA